MSDLLTERGLAVIIEAAHPSRPDRDALTRHHVERIITDCLASCEERLAAVETLANGLVSELVECRSFIYVETRHQPTVSGLTKVIDEARAALHPDPSEASTDA